MRDLRALLNSKIKELEESKKGMHYQKWMKIKTQLKIDNIKEVLEWIK